MSQERERPDMSGALFKAKEQKSENSPPYTGRIKIGGQEYRIAAWVNESQSGQKYFSIKVSEPEDAPRNKPEPKRLKDADEDADGLPF